jgi:septal ring factor EnvC (AmiA/AmiB activator)
MQHERDAERRQAWSAAHNAPKPAPSATEVELDRERTLRQEAELNVARFRSEIQHQQAQLGALTSERDELKRSLARVEAELLGVAASDHTQQMAYSSSYPSTAAQAAPPRERLQESRAGNAFVGGIRAVPSVTKPGMPVVTSRRGKYE